MKNLILVIDDSKTVSKVIEVGLGREGYEVVCCDSGERALRWLASSTNNIPDLILVDLFLPEMDGYSVIRVFRSHSVLAHIPIVIISRRNGFIDTLRGKLVGANAHLVKPLEMTNLLSVVGEYIGTPTLVMSAVSPVVS